MTPTAAVFLSRHRAVIAGRGRREYLTDDDGGEKNYKKDRVVQIQYTYRR